MARHASARCQSYRCPGETPAHPLRLSVSGSAIKDIPLCSIGSLPSSPFTPLSLPTSGGRPIQSRTVTVAPRKAPAARRTLQRDYGASLGNPLCLGFGDIGIAVCYKYRQRSRRSGGMIVEAGLQLSNVSLENLRISRRRTGVKPRNQVRQNATMARKYN
jgi:hypothetical protein